MSPEIKGVLDAPAGRSRPGAWMRPRRGRRPMPRLYRATVGGGWSPRPSVDLVTPAERRQRGDHRGHQRVRGAHEEGVGPPVDRGLAGGRRVEHRRAYAPGQEREVHAGDATELRRRVDDEERAASQLRVVKRICGAKPTTVARTTAAIRAVAVGQGTATFGRRRSATAWPGGLEYRTAAVRM